MTIPGTPALPSGSSRWAVRRFRDLTVLDDGGPGLVLATDSVGGIGPKPSDTVAVPGATTAHFATRVPLLEVLCAGARPLVVVNALCVERDPLGLEMMAEVRALAAAAGVPADGVTGSTEDNVPTAATGIGVTVIGELGAAGLLSGGGRARDVVLCLGLPRSAPRDTLYPGHPDLVPVEVVAAVLATGLVSDALPVGSRGVGAELEQLAASASLVARHRPDSGVDLVDSGGPSTCVLVACAPGDESAIRAVLPPEVPVAVVAKLGPA